MSQAELKHFLAYDPVTGLFSWNYREPFFFRHAGQAPDWNRRHSGQNAGGLNDLGYIQIGLHRHNFLAHRLAVLYQTGIYPAQEVDHINHNRADNSWANLRLVNRAGNQQNQSRDSRNTSGITGVFWDKSCDRWIARINIGRKNTILGRFVSLDEASAVRKKAEIEQGYHPNHGMAR
jgi:hypothetical protein